MKIIRDRSLDEEKILKLTREGISRRIKVIKKLDKRIDWFYSG